MTHSLTRNKLLPLFDGISVRIAYIHFIQQAVFCATKQTWTLGLTQKAGTVKKKKQSTVTCIVDGFLSLLESHFIKYHQNTFPTAVHMYKCTNTSTTTQTHSSQTTTP